MKDRIKKIRKALDITQQEFAMKLGIARNNVAGYEAGNRNPSDAVISLICTKFNVNEEWLRTGSGEMFKPSPSSELDLLAAKYQLTNKDYIFIEKLLKNRKAMNAMEDFCIEYASAILSDTESADAAAYPQDFENMPVEERLDLYNRGIMQDIAAEAAYEKSLGVARNSESTASNTTAGTGSIGQTG